MNDDIQKLALKTKHHEDNLKFLKTQINGVDESIIDMQGKFRGFACCHQMCRFNHVLKAVDS